MRDEIRNKRIAELYLTGDFTNRELATRYKVSRERIRQLVIREIGSEKYKLVRQMKKERTAERIKENYLAGLK
ncbi:hypothetical protein EOL99_03900 [Candidatus Falkowbacteria bacterium]|nr:hypothetical protein [Candidatus Falkowbacteria bacterium]